MASAVSESVISGLTSYRKTHQDIAPLIDSIIEYVQIEKTDETTRKVTKLFLATLKTKIEFHTYSGEKWMYIYNRLTWLEAIVKNSLLDLYYGHKYTPSTPTNLLIDSVFEKAFSLVAMADLHVENQKSFFQKNCTIQ